MDFESQLRKGTLELCVLTLVASRDRYGYELVEAISHYFEVSEGTIYPILRRLTKDGLLEKYLEESSEGPPRKYYKINRAGLARMKEMHAQWRDFSGSIDSIISEFGGRGDRKRLLKST